MDRLCHRLIDLFVDFGYLINMNFFFHHCKNNFQDDLKLFSLSLSSATKACFISSFIFLLSHIGLLKFESELIYLCIASMFIYVRVITLFFKQYDPLMPFENLSSGLLFNSWIETIVKYFFLNLFNQIIFYLF